MTPAIETNHPSKTPKTPFYFVPQWSPDGSRLAFTDTDYRVLTLDVETGRVTHVATDRYAHPQRSMNPIWSPDSRWIAYAPCQSAACHLCA